MSDVATHISLPQPVPFPVIGAGADLKNTVCVAKGTDAWVSPPHGDLADVVASTAYMRTLTQMPEAYGVLPTHIAVDAHPAYISRALALRGDVWPDAIRCCVPHHAAHIAAVAAATGETGAVCGMAFDGTGYGDDGTIWGGEFFLGTYTTGYCRVGHLHPLSIPGGEAAIHAPWRCGVAVARRAGIAEEVARACMTIEEPEETWRVVWHIADPSRTLSPRTTSMGRLFDGVSALLGICSYAPQEAAAAIALEKCAADACVAEDAVPPPFTCEVYEANGLHVLDWRPLVRALVDARRDGMDVALCAAYFHLALAEGAATLCARVSKESTSVLAGGGVFWNTLFSRACRTQLAARGLSFVTSASLPPSDAALSVGQAVLAHLYT